MTCIWLSFKLFSYVMLLFRYCMPQRGSLGWFFWPIQLRLNFVLFVVVLLLFCCCMCWKYNFFKLLSSLSVIEHLFILFSWILLCLAVLAVLQHDWRLHLRESMFSCAFVRDVNVSINKDKCAIIETQKLTSLFMRVCSLKHFVNCSCSNSRIIKSFMNGSDDNN